MTRLSIGLKPCRSLYALNALDHNQTKITFIAGLWQATVAHMSAVSASTQIIILHGSEIDINDSTLVPYVIRV